MNINIEELRALAALLNEQDLSALELTEGDSRIRLERACAAAPAPAPSPAPMPEPAPQAEPVPAPAPEPMQGGVDFNRLTEVKSPMVGVFYAAKDENSRPFVSVGDYVKKGDTLCILEAMKLMNEIQAEQDGEIVDICAQNGELVEYGQTLFKIY